LTSEAHGDGRQGLEDVLRRIDESKVALVVALESTDPSVFETETAGGESIQHAVQRATDEVDFYYGRLVALALKLPQPPGLTRADYGSQREGVMALQVAHRRFTNLLHDLVPDDLAKMAADPELGSYSLLQILELAAAQYAMRAQQVQRLAAHARQPSG
jgi:hypothetical protein